MSIRFFWLLFIFFFSANSLAVWSHFRPNFNVSPISLPTGSQILPICNNPADPLCMSQWSQQSTPLTIYPPNFDPNQSVPYFENFLLSLISSGFVDEHPALDKDWELWMPSFSDFPSREKKRRSYYRNTKDETQVRVVDEETGKVTAGELALIPSSSIISEEESEDSVDSSNFGSVQKNSDGSYTVTEGMKAVSVTSKENLRPGCLNLKKGEEEEITTEAGFCFDCDKNTNSKVLTSLVSDEGFWSKLKKLFSSSSNQSEVKLTNLGVTKEKLASKVCSPYVFTTQIIKNFERTCNAKFDDFYKKAFCDSCRKQIPPEVMMAMMSVESAGRCKARNDGSHFNTKELSLGLFQVNAQQHTCKNLQKNFLTNTQCLEDPFNNLATSLNILSNHYKQVNPSSLGKLNSPFTSNQCDSWLDMSGTKKDAWRRGVSAYNGGPGWVTRAIKSVREEETLDDTSHLVGSQKGGSYFYKNDTASWEDLRVYYFAETLSPSNRIGTGRRVSNTLSNIAHTEAVLGRNLKSSNLSMVDIWAQYTKDFVNENKNLQCL